MSVECDAPRLQFNDDARSRNHELFLSSRINDSEDRLEFVFVDQCDNRVCYFTILQEQSEGANRIETQSISTHKDRFQTQGSSNFLLISLLPTKFFVSLVKFSILLSFRIFVDRLFTLRLP